MSTGLQDIVTQVLLFLAIALFLFGLGFLIDRGMTQSFEIQKSCIDHGMTYVGGKCLK